MSRILRTDVTPILSKAVEYHGFVFTQGIVARDLSGDISAQTRDIFMQLEDLLERHGTDNTRILQAQIWLKNIDDRAEFNKIWENWLPEGQAPARACVQASLADPDMLVEVMLVTTK